MPLTKGTRVGPYEIGDPLGAGGMGEVYRARDAKLHRDVAVKILPDALADDPDRLARFEREAIVLAALNHPNIAHVYGLEVHEAQSRRQPCIVMEFVDGPDLAQRIAGGAMPVDEALAIARQLADALDAAHDQGIVHRDLKPSNIKVTADGAVKVLDFGLAKALDAPRGAGAGPASLSPTITTPAQMTHAGVVLGTAAYMSPEQAKGKPIDKRTDIWAFGCVLFEMLTGRAVFAAETVTETLAAVMRDTPPLDLLPAGTPPRVRRLIARCLERDPKQRLRDIGDARLELAESDREPAGTIAAPPRSSRTLAIAVAAAAVTAALLAGGLAWRLARPADLPVRKLDLALEANFAKLAPDGAHLAFLAGDHVFVRELTASEPRDLGTAAREVNGLWWSPDSATILLASRDGKMRTIPARGGAPLVLCEIPESREVIGAAWLGDQIALAVWRGSLYRVPARGGTPTLWLAADADKEYDFHAIAPLPDGRVVFAAHHKDNRQTIETFDGTRRAALTLSGDASALEGFGNIGSFVYSPTGHLLYTRFDANPGLWAAPLTGGAMEIAKAFLVAANAVSATVADDGTLLITNGSAGATYQLAALTRDGQVERTIGAAASVVKHPAVSPNGRRIAVLRTIAGQDDLWIEDLGGGAAARLTFENDSRLHPSWFPDSARVLVSEHATKISDTELSVFAIDGANKPQALVKGHRGAVSPTGSELLFLVDDRGANRLRSAAIGADGRLGTAQRVFTLDPEPDVRDFALSPDGRLLAYVDYKNGQADLLLTKYPGAQGRWQIVASGGPALWGSDGVLRWAHDTSELFFALSSTADPKRARVMAAKIAVDREVTAARPVALFDMDLDDLQLGFDVAPNGQSVFMPKRTAAPQRVAASRFVLVQHWFAEFAK